MKHTDSDKVRVCHLSIADGTISCFLLGLLGELNRSGYEAYAVSSPGKKAEEIRDAGVRYHPIPMTRRITPFRDLSALRNLYKFLRRDKIQILQTHTPKALILGSIAGRLANVPIVITTLHGLHIRENTSSWKRFLWLLFYKFVAMLSDFTISVNKEDALSMIYEGICNKKTIEALDGGVGRNLDLFSPDRFLPEFIKNKKQGLGIPSDCLVIGIVARMVREKGFLDLFEAFSLVKKEFSDTVLLVVGETDWEKKDYITPQAAEKYRIENATFFLGERTDMPELYSIMDIFVLPTYREGFPVTLMEAAAMGRAVIATNITGCRDVVEDGKTGLLVAPGDPRALANALVTLIRSPELRQKMGEMARKKALRDFDEKDFYSKQKKIYQRLLEEKTGNN